MPPLALVDGQAVSTRDLAETLARVEGALGSSFTLYTLNLDHLVKRRESVAFRDVYARATFVTADGWPVVLLARRSAPGMRRTAGADLVVPLCRLAARHGRSVYLFGTQKSALEAASARLRAEVPGLRIAGRSAPAFGFDPVSPAATAAAREIAASGADLCLVALGAPKQERFSDFARDLCPGVGFVCIGAGLDFVAGTQRRAPPIAQILGVEWAWRLILAPRRLGLRYLRCAMLFAGLVGNHLWRR